jgi:hypothetical protein
MPQCLEYSLDWVYKLFDHNGDDIMYGVQELKQRLIIIKHSDLDDATILDENYLQLIKETPNPDEKEQFIVLRSIVRRRIKHLVGDNGK